MTKKLVSLFSVLAIVACMFAGCAKENKTADTSSKESGTASTVDTSSMTPAEILAKASENMDALDSATNAMVMDMVMSMSVASEKQDVTMKMTMDQKSFKKDGTEISYAKSEMDTMGEKTSSEVYIAAKGDSVKTYTNDGTGWALSAEKNSLASLATGELFNEDSAVTELGADTVGTTAVTKYEAVLGKVGLNALLSEVTGSMEAAAAEALLAAAGDVKMVVYIDKAECRILKITFDMKEVMKSVITQLFESMMQGIEFTLDVSKVDIEMTFSDFNKVAEFEIPAEALAATAAA